MKMPFVHCVAQYGTFTSSIVGLTTTSDGALLAIAPQEGNIELWDVSAGDRLCSIPVPKSIAQSGWNSFGGANEIYSLALSDDGLFLAASSFKTGDISVWTFEGESVGRIKGDGSFTRTVSFLPNTSLLIVALRDTRIQLWNAEKQQLHATLPGADEKDASALSGLSRMYRVVCSSDGSQIALASTTDHSPVSLWEVRQEDGKVYCVDQSVLHWSKEEVFRDAKFRPSHTQLYHLAKKTIEGYDTNSLKLARQVKYSGVMPETFCFSPQGDFLAFADYDGMVYLWGMEKDESIFQFDAREGGDPLHLYYDASVQQMVWLSQSNLLATAGLKKNDGSGINTVKLWQLTL